MKKKYILRCVIHTMVILTFSIPSNSQGIYQFGGTTAYGGPDDMGTLFTAKYDGTGQVVKKYFMAENPGVPNDKNKAVYYNNKLYTVMSGGGLHNEGIISAYDIATGVYEKKVDFYSHDIAYASCGLTLFNGKMYSVSEHGGDNGSGTLYEFDPATGSITIKHHFDQNTGKNPTVELTVYNNKLYGITQNGGANDKGVIYEFNAATNALTVLVHMSDYYAGSTAFTVFQNKLWSAGDHVIDIATHSIFSFDPATNIIEYKKGLHTIGGTTHSGEFVVLNNQFYGITDGGGIHGSGLIFQYDPITNQLTKEYDLQNVVTATGNLSMIAYNGLLYGASERGGANNMGVIFHYDPATNQYNNKVIFSDGNGGKSTTTLCLYNDIMYLWTYEISTSVSYKGKLKEYNPIINSYTSLLSLNSSDLSFPIGEPAYFNHKIYGITYLGGADNNGGIYEYDPATELYTLKVNFPATVLKSERSSLTIINGKIYGLMGLNAPMGGMIFEYEPGSNTITEIHTFNEDQGIVPAGNLSFYNGKFYGVTHRGGNLNWGTIFEYNPQTNVFATKVNFDSTRGSLPQSGLTLYNDKFYGVASKGGTNNDGTLYEYNPSINGFLKKADFEINSSGSEPIGGLVVYNNKMYGVTSDGSIDLTGSIYSYDANTEILSTLVPQSPSEGRHTLHRLTIMNDKLYGSATAGGLEKYGGTIFEFDPALNTVSKKSDFIGENGRLPRYNKLITMPALTAPGTLNTCTTSNSVNINSTNADKWVAFTDAEGRAVAEINANGNILGVTAVSFYVNADAVRQNADNLYYLDRNISIRTENQPLTSVMIRLYIRSAEFEALKAAVGGNLEISDLSIYQNNDPCEPAMISSITALTTHKANWATDYVLTTSTDSLTSFYFANLDRVLPIHLISFTGKKEQEKNLLNWRLTCTNDVQFSIERSTNGQSFVSIGSLDATQQQCSEVFNYYDSTPMPGINYYRLRITENNGVQHFSNIISIERSEFAQNKLSIFPNPIMGSILQINLNVSQPGSNATLAVYDATGRKIAENKYSVQLGMNRIQMKIGNLTSGVYTLLYTSGQHKIITRFVK